MNITNCSAHHPIMHLVHSETNDEMNQLLSPRRQPRRPLCQVSMTSGRTGAHRGGQSADGSDGRPPCRRGAPRLPLPLGWGEGSGGGRARHQALQGDQEGHSLKTEEIQTTRCDEFLGSFEQFHVTLEKLAGSGGGTGRRAYRL